MSAFPGGLPPDIHLLIMSNINCPRDLRSWIAANPQAFKQVTDYKSAVLGNYIDCNLLPELLAVVRLRQMHTRNPVKPTTDELVELVRELVAGIGPRAPDHLWPEDIRSVLGLLKVIEEVCIVLSGLWVHDYENTEQYYFLPWRFLPSSRRSQSEWTTEPDDAENLFYKQRAVLCFEIYVQSLYLGRAPDESSSELELCCSLDMILCTWELEEGLFPVWQCFDKIVKFFYRRYDEYLWLVLHCFTRSDTKLWTSSQSTRYDLSFGETFMDTAVRETNVKRLRSNTQQYNFLL
ncbi:hypothetical protein GCG54_00000494 [Colletotrichum gloeosporioides]|uniref:Uncharacterized protein n=1 Tax=Colletotrichum gloeosporioides TaxID=474922 RepID=A0A8H4CHK3_COLGL|nr:uncharacterized protein GCG54_00000494 [Colletotrichum gloeosporioides]KAF3804145.1 hypothetical protein GCG54_00000494 [Colletotrichum gloeosporioides]